MPSHAAASRGSISPAIAYQQDPYAGSVSFIGSKPDHPLPRPKPHLQAHQAIEEDLSAKETWYNWGSRVVDPGLEWWQTSSHCYSVDLVILREFLSSRYDLISQRVLSRDYETPSCLIYGRSGGSSNSKSAVSSTGVTQSVHSKV